MPVTWLLEHAGPSIKVRLATEVFPGLIGAEEVARLRSEVEGLPSTRQILKKQKEAGSWGNNLLATGPSKSAGIKEAGTIPQFRRLLELGLTQDHRAIRIGTRILYRLVSRDADPKLLMEYEKFGIAEPGAEPWIRTVVREAAAAALAQAGFADDPRVRGAAHKILNEVSQFLRSEMAQDPFVRSGRAWILNPIAYPPTVFSVALLSRLPAVQRERAGLVERIGSYLATAAPKKAFSVAIGKKALKPTFLLLGDPIHAAANGQTDDLPNALYWMETMAQLGCLHQSPSAGRVWARLVKECDDVGVWRPKNVRSQPRSASPWSWHAFPLDADSKKMESRLTDVTFRMALIARVAGWELQQA